MAYDKPFENKPNFGSLFATKTKTNPAQSDYWGDIKIDLSTVDTTNGIATVRLSGWKKKSEKGTTYLSLAVNNWKSDSKNPQPKKQEIQDDDLEF